MARKKHARKTHHRRRRSMSGLGKMGSGALVKIAGAVAGKVVANYLDGMLGADMAGRKYIVAGAPVAAGLLLPMVSKSATVKGLAEGMLIYGGVALAQSTGVLKGIGVADETPYQRNFVALGPTFQNQRGVVAGVDNKETPYQRSNSVAGLDLRKAALLS